MEATQLLSDSALDESELFLPNETDRDNTKKLIGVLVFDDDQNEINIFQGDTISIGRDPEKCEVMVDNKSLSRVHAVLEVDRKDGEVLIYDNKSMNHTWKDDKKLKPLVRYQLSGGEKLKFGVVPAVLQIHSKSNDVSESNSTFIGTEKVLNGTSSENDRNMVFIPETPTNNCTMKGNWNKKLPCLDVVKPSDTETKENTFFVPESQNTPHTSLQNIDASSPSNDDLYYLNKSRNNYISKVRDTCELSFGPFQNDPEKAEFDDSSFLAPTQAIPNNSYISNSLNVEKENEFASRTNSKVKQSNNRFSEIGLLQEETQKIVPQIKCIPASGTQRNEKKRLLPSEKHSPITQNDGNTLIAETQRMSEQNSSLLMAETQKIHQHTYDILEHETRNLPRASLNLLIEDTQHISMIDNRKSVEQAEVSYESTDKSNNLKSTALQQVDEGHNGDFVTRTHFPAVFLRSIKPNDTSGDKMILSQKVTEKEVDNSYNIDMKDGMQNDDINKASTLPLTQHGPCTEPSRELKDIDSTSLKPLEGTRNIEDDNSCCSNGSENLLADICNDDDTSIYTYDNNCRAKDVKEMDDKEYVEVYEGATQILGLDDEKETTGSDTFVTTKLDADEEDMILSSQDSACSKRNKTDLISRTMSLTQSVHSEFRNQEIETQYDNTSMNMSTQSIEGNMPNNKNITGDKVNVLASGDSDDELITHSECPYIKVCELGKSSSDRQGKISCDSDEDSIDMLASTQELMKGLIEDEWLEENKEIAKTKDEHKVCEEIHQLHTNHTNTLTLNTENNFSLPPKKEANHVANLAYDEKIAHSLEKNVPSVKMNIANTSFPDTESLDQEEENGMTSSYKENGISKESLLSVKKDSSLHTKINDNSSINVHDKFPVTVLSQEVTPARSQDAEKNKCIGEQTLNASMTEITKKSSKQAISIKKGNQSFSPENLGNVILSLGTPNIVNPNFFLTPEPKMTEVSEKANCVISVENIHLSPDKTYIQTPESHYTKNEIQELQDLEKIPLKLASTRKRLSSSNENISTRGSGRKKACKPLMGTVEDGDENKSRRCSPLKILSTYTPVNTMEINQKTSVYNLEQVSDTDKNNRKSQKYGATEQISIESPLAPKTRSNSTFTKKISNIRQKENQSISNKGEASSTRTLRSRKVVQAFTSKTNQHSINKPITPRTRHRISLEHRIDNSLSHNNSTKSSCSPGTKRKLQDSFKSSNSLAICTKITPKKIIAEQKLPSEENIELKGLSQTQNRTRPRSSALKALKKLSGNTSEVECFELSDAVAMKTNIRLSRNRGPRGLSIINKDQSGSSKKYIRGSSISICESVEKLSTSRKRIKYTVMFTGYDDPQHQQYLKELGCEIALSAKDQPTVLVTDKLRRTEKLLCALGRGIPIVSKDWVTRSNSVKTILDPNSYIIKDKDMEKKFGFCLKKSIEVASKRPLLLNYKFHATKSCTPPPEQIKEIVECAGGSWLKQMPKKKSDDIIIISCPEDKNLLKKAINAGFNVQDKEFLLTGLLKQDLNFESHVQNIL